MDNIARDTRVDPVYFQNDQLILFTIDEHIEQVGREKFISLSISFPFGTFEY